MSATINWAYPASMTERSYAQRMSFSTSATCMCMFASATGIQLLKTGVVTSVSLFVLVVFIVPLLLVAGLVVLISLSLLLTGLTGLVRLESLVGRESEPTARTVQGD